MEALKVFKYALMKEKEGLVFFTNAAERANNAEAKKIFNKLKEEEAKHIEFITEQIALIKDGKAVTEELADKLNADNYFEKQAQKEMLDQMIDESMIPDISILHFAYMIERDLSEFYAQSAENYEGQAKKALMMLANWEKTHEVFFKQIHDKLMDIYSKQPWGG